MSAGAAAPADAALFYAPDGYDLSTPKLMGRQAAGHSFLRAVVQGRGDGPVWGCAPRGDVRPAFEAQVAAVDPAAEARWCPAHRLDLLEGIGTLSVPGPDLGAHANLRLRRGPAAYSICGVTHTTASHRAQDALSSLARSALMEWDAIICTSAAVAETVRIHRAAEDDYLAWRFGAPVTAPLPQLPVIPLGIHCDDFAANAEARAAARAALGLAEDEVLALYTGRLSFHAKAHPDPMYRGLEEAARRAGVRVALLQCGWFANDGQRRAFEESAATAAPRVRALFSDGRDPAARAVAWAAADLFVSLADNIQETFGLTPLEAMASGLPVVVTDWNGYRDTVRDGIDGMRVPTMMAPAEPGSALAGAYESGVANYDRYCGLAAQLVAIDDRRLVDALAALIGDPALRRRMGEAGRARARGAFDWRVVYPRYQELWRELATIRSASAGRTAPVTAPARLDPLLAFAHYPTHLIGTGTVVAARHRPDGADYRTLAAGTFFSLAEGAFCTAPLADAMLAASARPLALADLAARLGTSAEALLRPAVVLAKMGLLTLHPLETGGTSA